MIKRTVGILLLCGNALYGADQKTLEVKGGLNQPVEHWLFTNDAARTGATGFFPSDLGKLGYQTDTQAYYKLTGTTPTWEMVGPDAGFRSLTVNGTPVTIASTDRFIVIASCSSTTTLTLPLANSVPPNTTIRICDKSALSLGAISISRSGADTFWPGSGSSVTLLQSPAGTSYQGVALTSDGSAFWFISPFSVGLPSSSGHLMQAGAGGLWLRTTFQWPLTISGGGGGHPMYASSSTNVTEAVAGYPLASAGAAGYNIKSDGTNFVSYPNHLYVSSVASVSGSYASDTYLAGSTVTITAGDWKAQGQYHCVFDMTKTGAGTAAAVLTVRMGTLGTTSDAAIVSQTYTAGTAAADTGLFELWTTFRTVGAGTTAVMSMSTKIDKTLTTTGLINSATTNLITAGTISSGFNSTTQTKIGLSFNGGSSFSGTNTFCNCELKQP